MNIEQTRDLLVQFLGALMVKQGVEVFEISQQELEAVSGRRVAMGMTTDGANLIVILDPEIHTTPPKGAQH